MSKQEWKDYKRKQREERRAVLRRRWLAMMAARREAAGAPVETSLSLGSLI